MTGARPTIRLDPAAGQSGWCRPLRGLARGALVLAGLGAAHAIAAPQRAAPARPSLSPRWASTLPDAPAGVPASDGARLYVALRSSRLVALALGSGAIEWSVDAGERPILAAGDGLVFVAAASVIEARAAEGGAVRWRASLDGDAASALTWDQGWLLAVTRGGTAVAIRARDGQVVWRRSLGASTAVAPALAADRVYFALADHRIVAARLLTGDPAWERKLGDSPGPMLPLDDRLFVGAKDHFLYCLATKNGSVSWRWRAGGDVVGAPVVDERSVYFVSLDNVLRALDRGNGHQRWRQLLATRPSGGPLRLDADFLLVAGITAEVRAYRSRDGALAAEIPAPAELAVPPQIIAAAGGAPPLLIVVTLDGQVQAFEPALRGIPVPGLPMFLPLPIAPGTPLAAG